MKLERDKVYRARNGSLWRVVCVDAPGTQPVVVHEAAPEKGCGYVAINRIHADGQCYLNREADCDLIAEHREPRTIYAVFSDDDSGWFYFDRAAAERKQPNVAIHEYREVLADGQ